MSPRRRRHVDNHCFVYEAIRRILRDRFSSNNVFSKCDYLYYGVTISSWTSMTRTGGQGRSAPLPPFTIHFLTLILHPHANTPPGPRRILTACFHIFYYGPTDGFFQCSNVRMFSGSYVLMLLHSYVLMFLLSHVLVFFFVLMFLVADTQLYERLCPSVRPSVRRLVGPWTRVKK